MNRSGQEPVEVMEQDPIEDRALRMARTVDSRHIGGAVSRSMLSFPKGRIGGRSRNRATTGCAQAHRDRWPGGPPDHADARRRGDHRARAVQRPPHLPVRPPRDRGLHLDHQEV